MTGGRLRLAGVYAHPDDDTYGNGGVVALHEGRLDYTLIVATSGGAGTISDPALATPETLGEVREREERDALAAIGAAHAGVHFLRYPDGGLADVPRDELVEGIVGPLREARPHVVVTFGPEGVTKHPDHVAAHQAATEAFHRLQAEERGDGFQRLLYNALPQSSVDRFWKEVRRAGLDIGQPDDPFMPHGVPDHTITVRVDCSSVRDRKLTAVRAHRTQRQEMDVLPPAIRDELLGTEWFVQAWPPITDPGGPLTSDPFDGLV